MAIALQRARRMMFMINVRTVVGTHLHWGETKFTLGIKIETWPFHHIASPSIQSYKHTTCRLKVNPWLKLCVCVAGSHLMFANSKLIFGGVGHCRWASGFGCVVSLTWGDAQH